eukprot:109313-Pyramimonas_sp.AAC.1
MHRRRRRAANRAPHRATPPMHRRCGAILRPHPLGPHPGGLEPQTPASRKIAKPSLSSCRPP